MSSYERFLVPFDRSVLLHYRASPDLYEIEEDDMGGRLKTIGTEEELEEDAPPPPWFDVRFAFRRLADGRVCIAAFGPDLSRLPEQDQLIWLARRLEHPQYAPVDPVFDRWAARNLEGSWETESGPLPKTRDMLHLLRALTKHTVGVPLWRSEWSSLITYPVAENTEAYANAHLELYRVLVDGLDVRAVALLAERLGIELSDPSKSMNSMKEILPADLMPVIYKPLRKCYEVRQRKHGVPTEPMRSFPAFDTFNADVSAIAVGLEVLNDWLQDVLSASSEACLRREEAMSGPFWPKIVGPPQPQFKLNTLRQVEGKTIEKVEFGAEQSHPDKHESEAIVLHFTDGSAIAIQVGSNVWNLASDREDLSPSDFSTDLMVMMAPSPTSGETGS